MSTYRCARCGQHHDGPPLSYGQTAPALWFSVPEAERSLRCELSSDQCVIDNEHFFILGRVELPIIGRTDRFVWLSWVSLSEKNFRRASELWHTAGRESEPSYFGWLSSSLPYEANTVSLKVSVHARPVGERPSIEVEPTGHRLAVEQRQGISMRRVQELAERFAHEAP